MVRANCILPLTILVCFCDFISSESDNSDAYLDSYQLIKKYGFEAEKHQVITEDGYVLTVFRIAGSGPPVLLGHGIADSSDAWLVLGPSEALAFLLAKKGLDVWLINVRGNTYSKEHVRKLRGKEYWDFSFEQMGTKDLPATIDYILLNTDQTKLTYIGFSQGTTMFFVMCSMLPQYNDKVEQAFLFAPIAWISNAKQPFFGVLSRSLDVLSSLANLVNLHEVVSSNPVITRFHAEGCKQGQATKVICDLEFLLSHGVKNRSSISPSRFPVIVSHLMAGASIKTTIHFMQNFRSKDFRRFDHGAEKNLNLYGSSVPPKYDVSKITTPVTLFVSESDWYSDIEDVKILLIRLPNVRGYFSINKSLDFTHVEYCFGSRAKTMVYDKVIKLLGTEKV